MKKAYIQPSVEEYKLELANMIASSVPTSNETPTEWGAPELPGIPPFVFEFE